MVLALDLEPWLQEKARSNQRVGGQNKGSSTLATASRVDVRCEIAVAATAAIKELSFGNETSGLPCPMCLTSASISRDFDRDRSSTAWGNECTGFAEPRRKPPRN